MFVFLVAFTLHFVLLCKRMSSSLICLSTLFLPSWKMCFRNRNISGFLHFFSVIRETCEWVEWTLTFLMFAVAEVSSNISFDSNLQIQAVRPISRWVTIDHNCGLRFFSLHSIVSIFQPYKSLWFLSIINPRINYNPVQWFRNMDYFLSPLILLCCIRRIHLFSCWYEPFIGISFLLSRGNISKWNFPVCHCSSVILFFHITCTPQLGLCMTHMIY